MDSNTSTNETNGPGVMQLAMSTKHSFLFRFDSESIRVFLRKYSTHCRKFSASASQLVGGASPSLELLYPVRTLYCVGAKQLKTAVKCFMIECCTDVDELKTTNFHKYLDKEAEESRKIVTKASRTTRMQVILQGIISMKFEKRRMKLFFMEYLLLFTTNSLK